ncbi:hypothetical protein NliqN6_2298 [Naganishia liquefaciens]|uniref:Uncharacterized protein n=1 Tax=Naganishia liquefaciens TaxID=104408 RepID=A0A8H3TS02_9TREE|nr:hypothetical protein NliqN6_2298 [Naganishia liquefaciens]
MEGLAAIPHPGVRELLATGVTQRLSSSGPCSCESRDGHTHTSNPQLHDNESDNTEQTHDNSEPQHHHDVQKQAHDSVGRLEDKKDNGDEACDSFNGKQFDQHSMHSLADDEVEVNQDGERPAEEAIALAEFAKEYLHRDNPPLRQEMSKVFRSLRVLEATAEILQSDGEDSLKRLVGFTDNLTFLTVSVQRCVAVLDKVMSRGVLTQLMMDTFPRDLPKGETGPFDTRVMALSSMDRFGGSTTLSTADDWRSELVSDVLEILSAQELLTPIFPKG